MGGTVTLPVWLLVGLALLAGWSLLDRLLVPSVRWFLRQRTERVIDELNTRLRIQIQPFKLTKRRVLVDRVTYHPRVLEMVDATASETGTPRAVLMSRVERYAEEIVPAFNAYLYFRVGYWLARRLARLLYRVRLGYADEAGLAAVPPGATVVFVMNHRSNMDYVLVGYLAAKRAALSYAVGEWARIWPLQTLIRSMGAYFIRRRSGDELYRRVLECYVHLATAAGVTQAIYPEGGLSRDGRLGEARLGLLDYMLRHFDPEGTRDVVFVPVGINYDRTLEDRTLLRGLDAGAARPGALRALGATLRFVGRNLALMARSRWHRFGYACVNFGSPVSARAFLRQRGVDFRRMDKEQRAPWVAELGRALMEGVGAVVPVLPVALVADVFAADPERPLGLLELKAGVHARIRALEAAGAHVYIPRRDQDYAVTVGVRMLTLRRLVREHDGLLRAEPAELPLLRYYANSVAHLLHRADAPADALVARPLEAPTPAPAAAPPAR